MKTTGKQEIYKTAAALQAQGRHPKNCSTARTTEDLRSPTGKVIPKGARVELEYLRRGAFSVTWRRSPREIVTVPRVLEDSLIFRSHYA